MRIERKTTITLLGTSVNLGDLSQLLSEFPAQATVHIRYTSFTGNDPRETDYVTFEISLPKP